jgi:ribosomal protein S25
MGEAKNKSSKQMRKQQRPRETKRQKTSQRRNPTKSDSIGRLNLEKYSQDDIAEVKKLKALTPFTVASKLNINISSAKKLLRTLEKDGIIQQVASGSKLTIYKSIK